MYRFIRKLKSISRFLNKVTNRKLKIIFCSFFVSLLLALVYSTFAINIVTTVIGLTLILSSIFLYLSEKYTPKQEVGLVHTKHPIPLESKTSRNVDIESGNYIEKNNGTYVQRDFNQNTLTDSSSSDYKNESVTINNQRVEIGSDISRMFDEFRDILNDMMSQSSNVIEAISQFSKELVKELAKNPQVKGKVCFNAEEYNNEKELVDGFVKILLTQEYFPIEEISFKTQFGDKNNIEFCQNPEEVYQKVIEYKGYKIGLFLGKHRRWIYRIQRDDLSFLEKDKRPASYLDETAIKNAKKEIDKEMTERFNKQENISISE
jgi:hypothetical protein